MSRLVRFLVWLSCCLAAGQAAADKRVALVFAQDSYRLLRPLDNAVNDGRAIEAALDDLGFEVVSESNRDLRRMRRALEDFREDAAGADVVMVFFAGHGVEISGENRLLPIDADASSLDRLKETSLPLEDVTRMVASLGKVGLIVLDACRNDPFGTATTTSGRGAVALAPAIARAVTPGLGRVGKAENVLFAFSAAPGETASDGATGNSPFTTALAKYIGTDGIEIRSVMTLVQQEVYDLSRGKQLPYVESGLPRLFFAASGSNSLPERERLLLAMADVTPDLRVEVETVATERGIPLAPLYGALLASGMAEFDAETRSGKLREAADAYLRVSSEIKQLAASDPAVEQLRDEAQAALSLGAFDGGREKLEAAVAADDVARRRLVANVVERSVSQSASLYLLGGVDAAQGKLSEALVRYRTAADLLDELPAAMFTGKAREQQIAVLRAIADGEMARGSSAPAFEAVERLLASANLGAAKAPADAVWPHNLSLAKALQGDLWLKAGDATKAVASYREAERHAELAVSLAPSDPAWLRDLAFVHNRIGEAFRIAGDRDAALESFSVQIAVYQRLIDSGLATAESFRDFATMKVQTADMLLQMRQFGEAKKAALSAIEALEEQLAPDPSAPDAVFALGVAQEKLGDVLLAEGDLVGAGNTYQVRHEAIAGLAQSQPENLIYRRSLSDSFQKRGDLAMAQGDLEGAATAYDAALTVMDALGAARSENASWQFDRSIIWRKTGDLQLAKGEPARALASFQMASGEVQTLLDKRPDVLDWRTALAALDSRMAQALLELGSRQEAAERFRLGLERQMKLLTEHDADPRELTDIAVVNRQLAALGDAPVERLETAVQILDALSQNGLLDKKTLQALDAIHAELAAARKDAQ